MKGAKTKPELAPKQREELLGFLKARFEKNLNRHPGLAWDKIKAKLEAKADKLWSLNTTAPSHIMPAAGSAPA